MRKAKRVQDGDYGVCVLRDPEGGTSEVVFYDDDDGRKRIVYEGQPTVGAYLLVPRASLVELASVPANEPLLISASLLRMLCSASALVVAGPEIGDAALRADFNEAKTDGPGGCDA